MPSHAPRKSKRAASISSRGKKTPDRGRLSAARARVKAEVKKGTYKTVKPAAIDIASECNVSPGSLRVSMSRNKIRNEAKLLHHETTYLPWKKRICCLPSCWPLTVHRCPSE